MKTLIAVVLAATAGAGFAAPPTVFLNHEPAVYRNLAQKAAADYKVASAKCNGMSGNDKAVCMAEAKAVRAHAEAEALAKYNSTPAGREKSLTRVAEADYAAAKARCEARSGADKDDCLSNAKSVHEAALADAKARDPASASAIDVADKTRATAHYVAQKTENAIETAGEKTRQVASAVAQKTESAMDSAGQKTRETAAVVADKTERAAATTRVAANDTMITSKVKANLATEPDLKSLSIHATTENGVVMLSGFVDSRAEADRAVKVARNVEGVTSVKSAIMVK